MDFWDLLFKKYADPFSLLDNVIINHRFMDFLEMFDRKHEEDLRWEFFLHKLSAWDDRTWEEFNHDLDFKTDKGLERPSDEDLTEIVKNSYDMIKDFNPQEGGE